MFRHLRIALALGLVGLFVFWAWHSQMVEYVPLVIDEHQRLVAAPTMATVDHLDRVEQVLDYYGEKHRRVSPTKLLIGRRLAFDTELLWNYTTKASENWLAHKP